jgi:uncharacterized membrane protein
MSDENKPTDKVEASKEVLASSASPINIKPIQRSEITSTRIATVSFEGPLPPPQILNQYSPEAQQLMLRMVEKQMEMAEKQMLHRHEIEIEIIQDKISARKWGTASALAVATLSLGLSAYLGFLGHATVAGTVASVTSVALAGIFITGRRAQEKELEEKRKELPSITKDSPEKEPPQVEEKKQI